MENTIPLSCAQESPQAAAPMNEAHGLSAVHERHVFAWPKALQGSMQATQDTPTALELSVTKQKRSGRRAHYNALPTHVPTSHGQAIVTSPCATDMSVHTDAAFCSVLAVC